MSTARLAELLAAYWGKRVDLDQAFGPQCMDLANLWLVTTGRKRVPGNASDYTSWRIPDADWVPNGPLNFPGPGDIVAWLPNVPAIGVGEYGHVAVALVASPQSLISIDQNWGGRRYVDITKHTYIGVAGWFALR